MNIEIYTPEKLAEYMKERPSEFAGVSYIANTIRKKAAAGEMPALQHEVRAGKLESNYGRWTFSIREIRVWLAYGGTKKAASFAGGCFGGILSTLQIERVPSSASGFRKP
jgi:hypothetical protein